MTVQKDENGVPTKVSFAFFNITAPVETTLYLVAQTGSGKKKQVTVTFTSCVGATITASKENVTFITGINK